MKNTMIKNIKYWSLGTALFLGACTYEAPEAPLSPYEAVNPSAGDANFEKFISIGNSLTAGFIDGALFNDGQKNSFPALLANRFAMVNGGKPFNQPDINSQNGFFQVGPGGVILGRLKLSKPTCNKSSITPAPTLGTAPGAFSGNKAQLNNFGVPGILLAQVLTPFTGGPNIPQNPAFNPLYARFASNPGTSTILGDALAAQPTFFTLGIGNNDVLGFATRGGTFPLTNATEFAQHYNFLLGQLVSSSKQPKGVVMTIPDVTSIPFLKAVTSNIRPFALDAATAANLNGLYQVYGLGNPGFQAGNVNYFTVVTADGTVRQFRPGKDLIVMSAPTNDFGFGGWDPCDLTNVNKQRAGMGIAKGLGTATPEPFPIPNQFVLDEGEVAAAQARTIEFNNIIKQAVATVNTGGKKVAIFDVYEFFKKVDSQGVFYGGVKITAALPFGNFISMDGVHPTQRGYAVAANEIIKVINKEFNAKLPLVDPLQYEGNPLPQ
jgi:lysophospholipase L1-like esterase